MREERVEISSWEQFRGLRYDSGGHYVLTEDINLDETPGVQINKFRGILDGNGYSIKNLHSSDDHVPALIQENEGVVKNLSFTGFDIESENNPVGGICVDNHGEIKNCSVEANLKSKIAVGGIATGNTGDIDNCSFRGSLEGAEVGGIATDNHDGFVKECQTSGQLKVTKILVGGIIGINDGSVKNCSSEVIITTDNQDYKSVTGGLIGKNHGLVSDSFFHGDIKPEEDSIKGTLVGRNKHTVRYSYTTIKDYSMIGEDLAVSKNNSIENDVNRIESIIIARDL